MGWNIMLGELSSYKFQQSGNSLESQTQPPLISFSLSAVSLAMLAF